jgi:hypothetical protein
MRGALAAVIALVLCSGCATQPPPAPPVVHTPPPTVTPQAPPVSAPAEGIPVGTTASGGTIRVNPPPPSPTAASSAVIDSTPSPDALAVLSTIPEPLGRPSDRSVATTAPVEPAPASAPADTTAAAPTDSASSAPTDSAGVPVPEPTRPLGDRPGSLASAALPDSVAAPAASTPPSSAPPAAPVSPDSCWRVQVAAPPERERAERLAEAARSQLVIAVVVERESGLYKVRSKDCLTAVAADDLKRRAIATGFDGAFRFLRKR